MLKRNSIDWPVALFLVFTPLLAIVATPWYFAAETFHWQTLSLAVFLYFATSLAITAGYHRLIAHKGFKAKPWLKAFLLLLGAGSFQGSALKWCTDHRRHHRKVDSDDDPYSIKRGFFYAHIGWLFLKDSAKFAGSYDPELVRDRLVSIQHKHYYLLAIIMGIVFPALLGLMWGDLFGGFFIAGVLRIVFVHHGTFFINSLCHTWGSRPFSDQVSARDNFVLAILTNGEGYHNFHHVFASDFRNGYRWYHWDPTKWFIKFCASFGQCSHLKKVPDHQILKYKLAMQQKILLEKGASYEVVENLRLKVEQAQASFKEIKAEYFRLKKDWSMASSNKIYELKAELRIQKIEMIKRKAQWNAYFKAYKAIPA